MSPYHGRLNRFLAVAVAPAAFLPTRRNYLKVLFSLNFFSDTFHHVLVLPLLLFPLHRFSGELPFRYFFPPPPVYALPFDPALSCFWSNHAVSFFFLMISVCTRFPRPPFHLPVFLRKRFLYLSSRLAFFPPSLIKCVFFFPSCPME